MRKKFKPIIITTLLISFLSSCATNPDGTYSKESIGTVGGMATGALIGSAFGGGSKGHLAGALIGGALGAAAGNMIGKSLDAQDRKYQSEAYFNAMEYNRDGTSYQWRNPNSGHSGSFVPKNVYRDNNGRYCREFTQAIQIGNQKQEGVGTACRNPDGSWAIVNNY